MKAIAWQAIFLLVLIGLSITATAVVLLQFLSQGNITASKLSCTAKLQKYCIDLLADKNPDWNSIQPTSGCEKYGIEAPPSKEKCKEILG